MEKSYNEELSFVELDLLYAWGCPSFEGTMKRLSLMGIITQDEDTRKCFISLRDKLIRWDSSQELYLTLFQEIRKTIGKAVKRKLELADQLLEMQRQEGK